MNSSACVSREDIRQVVVILAGSRTGSSFLFSALKSLGEWIAPTGEETPFYRMAGLGRFDGMSYSDEFSDQFSEPELERVFRFLVPDLGIKEFACENRELIMQSFVARCEIQWPGRISTSRRAHVNSELLLHLNQLPQDWTHWDKSYLEWIARLEKQGFEVDSAAYFASQESKFPQSPLEEPPFVTAEAKKPLSPELAQSKTLLLKTSTNIYRTKFLTELFPRAKFRWILLRRNPLATISALMDGWLSGGFHSHDIHPFGALDIKGYSNVKAGGERYWKFDMPPGWQDVQSSTLPEVCAFQWLSAYQKLEQFRQTCTDPLLDVSYEDLISANGKNMLKQILDFSAVAPRTPSTWDLHDPVASVAPPTKGKWRKREDDLLQLMEKSPQIRTTAQNIGYRFEEFAQWP